MGLSIAEFFKAALLVLNAMAILSERRVLQPMGLAGTPGAVAGDGTEAKTQIAQVLASVRMLLRWPLIILNGLTVVFILIFG